MPKFTDRVSRAPDAISANAVITAVLLLCVSARLGAKFAYAKSQLGWDDVFCVLGTMTSSAYMGVTTWLFSSTLGLHGWDISLDDFDEARNRLTVGAKGIMVLYGVAMIFTKLSILCLFFRLFRVDWHARVWIYIGIAGTLLTHVVGTILSITAGAGRDSNGNTRHLQRLNHVQIGISAANVVGDFYILLLPLIEVSRLQMTRSRKFGVLAVFSTGLLLVFILP
ncbi:MAG: hypothetical protein Q9216_006247 [Gyalolechia sp. 2 TL-2023]